MEEGADRGSQGRSGEASLRLMFWLFRVTVVPWPHFGLSAASFAAFVMAAAAPSPWLVTWAFGALCFGTSGVIAVIVRRSIQGELRWDEPDPWVGRPLTDTERDACEAADREEGDEW